jgi:lipid II isoglutaminyl synthase (glutamine-hydrolysing)
MSATRPIKIVHLYPKEMNIYGDTGNRLVLEKRLEWRGIAWQSELVSIGDTIPKDADIIIGGGGQDASQGVVEKDLHIKKSQLEHHVDRGTVMLMVCGMYQLLGRRFVTGGGKEIRGLDILPVETLAQDGRLIGNLTVERDDIGVMVGYENHSGRTMLDEGATPLAKVIRGNGNNDDSGYEGCQLGNIFATYMHGPILSKNPQFADLLLARALELNGRSNELVVLDDDLELLAQKVAISRPR